MVIRVSTTKIVSRPIDLVEEVIPEVTFIAIDTYIETSRKDEFIIGNLFDYNGNKISYTWDSEKNQVAALKGKNLSTEMIISASEFLRNLYTKSDQKIDVKELSTHIVNSLQEFVTPVTPKAIKTFNIAKDEKMTIVSQNEIDNNFIYDYESDDTEPVF